MIGILYNDWFYHCGFIRCPQARDYTGNSPWLEFVWKIMTGFIIASLGTTRKSRNFCYGLRQGIILEIDRIGTSLENNGWLSLHRQALHENPELFVMGKWRNKLNILAILQIIFPKSDLKWLLFGKSIHYKFSSPTTLVLQMDFLFAFELFCMYRVVEMR